MLMVIECKIKKKNPFFADITAKCYTFAANF